MRAAGAMSEVDTSAQTVLDRPRFVPLKRPKPQSELPWLLLTVAIMVVGGVVAKVAGSGSDPQMLMPSLAGVHRDLAMLELGGRGVVGLDLRVVDQCVPGWPAGYVVETVPAAGDQLSTGGVTVVVSGEGLRGC